ncbi:ComF family protein [Azospirillum thermophilum]|uniref:Amidophosphoribosyltransferase n=1 Tax=Azospirillum thermophilum TaxID=2202148 RepID=A0A2S2CNX7_9PROT|nr:ComF family protein [Azospirillum thermophilum]AWK86176.1 amidophosphoribosyltransferase [Azospirillum thermophilum]
MRLARRALSLLGLLLDALLPPRCLACGTAVDRQGGLCAACWTRLTFIAPPCCACCGLPFDFAVPEETLCGACLANPPPFDRARAVLVYDDGSRPLLLGFKHGDRIHAAGAYATWLARAGAEILRDADLIVPVPLHRWRLFRRRYNQAALISNALSKRIGVATVPDLLLRRRATRTQGGLGRLGRARNVKGAFALRRGAQVAGKRVVLVDDVLTTGATLAECAAVLRRAGAARVDLLTLARVVKS